MKTKAEKEANRATHAFSEARQRCTVCLANPIGVQLYTCAEWRHMQDNEDEMPEDAAIQKARIP